MLKITPVDNDGRRTLVLEGKLIDPWVAELERTWSEARDSQTLRSVAVDLKDVTSISDHGEALLRRMRAEGAEVRCCKGILTKHVVRRLMQMCSGESRNRA